MSDLTICSHCGKSRCSTRTDIVMLTNGNNELEIHCEYCEKIDTIEVTKDNQVPIKVNSPEQYPLNSKWQNPDNGFIFEVLKHLESSVMLYNETVGKGVTYDMEKMSKLVKYETL